MASLLERIAAVLNKQDAQIADLKQKLADALANDAADAAAIAAAQADAKAARDALIPIQERVAELQGLVDADVAKDSQIDALLKLYEADAPPA